MSGSEESLVQATSSDAETSERSPDCPDAVVQITIARHDLRDGPFWIAWSNDLRGANGSGRTLREALAVFVGCLPDLWSVMADDVKAGKEPSEQFKAYQRLLTNGDRDIEPESDAGDLNQTSLPESAQP